MCNDKMSKEDFVKYINVLKHHEQKVDKLKQGLEQAVDGLFSFVLDAPLIDAVVDLLELHFHDFDKNIAYYIFVLEFGVHTNQLYDKLHIDFSSPETLYDYLTHNGGMIKV